MHSIITSYLLQVRKAELPYIGNFEKRYKPAATDIINKQILPPGEEIIFSQEAVPTCADLVKYISAKRNIPETEAGLALDKFCKEWKEKIDHGEALCFDSFGCLKKDESGIVFSNENNSSYYTPVPAIRVTQQDAGHDVLVGDTQTTSAAMLNYYNDAPMVEKRNWRVWALVLFIIALTGLVLSFYDQKFTTGTVGNRSNFTIKTAGETHFGFSK